MLFRLQAPGRHGPITPHHPFRPPRAQILQWVMSYDGSSSPDPMAITAASAALLVSGGGGPVLLPGGGRGGATN